MLTKRLANLSCSAVIAQLTSKMARSGQLRSVGLLHQGRTEGIS